MKRAFAIAALLSLAGCGSSDYGWDPVMECKQRDLKSALCTEATYSCQIDNQMLAYYSRGPRCLQRNVR